MMNIDLMKINLQRVIILCSILVLAACASHKPKSQKPFFVFQSKPAANHGYFEDDGPPDELIDLEAIQDAVPKPEPLSKYGNPASYLVNGTRYDVMKTAKGYRASGQASWYGKKWHGKRTSSGEPYNVHQMTAAHPTLPLPTYAQVTNLSNGKKVVVKINDRGPFRSNRIIDLSYAAAAKLDILAHGTAKVLVEAIDATKPFFLAKKENSLPKILDATDEYLQVGSFSLQENAIALVKNLEQLTQKSIQIKPVQLAEQTYYQVKIGPIASQDEIQALINQVSEAGLGQAIVAHA